MTYDFSALSPFEFELLVRDLLTRHLGVRLESFKAGRDEGIDLRYASSPGSRDIVVQCKHYPATTFSTLLSKLKHSELPKIDALSPERYIFVTSMPLSVGQKDRLAQVFGSHLKSMGDIVGREDLNSLIASNEDVERQHFKLWLSSTTVLNRVLNNEIYVRSASLREDMRRRMRVYVQNRNHTVALEALNDNHSLIIIGEPGIGKTILAEMIALSFVDREYDIVAISQDVSEGFQVFRQDQKQLFLYDDFLGQTNLSEKLNKNEDNRLLEFIELIGRSPLHRFILTTREYILVEASSTYPRLHQLSTGASKFVLHLDSYSQFDRARILYNHLYFSGVPQAAIESLLEERRYRKIVFHRNYNPRLIESVVKIGENWKTGSGDFADYLLQTLENPTRLWMDIFESELSSVSQAVLLTLASMPHRVSEDALKDSVSEVVKSRDGVLMTQRSYREALKVLDGTFITIEKLSGRGSPTRNALVVRFFSPSVRDFMIAYLSERSEEFQQLLESAVTFDQVVTLRQYLYSSDRRWQSARQDVPEGDFAAAFERTIDAVEAQVVEIEDRGGKRLVRHRQYSEEERVLKAMHSRLQSSGKLSEDLGRRIDMLIEKWCTREGDRGGAIDLIERVFVSDEDHVCESIEKHAQQIGNWFTQLGPQSSLEDWRALRDAFSRIPAIIGEESYNNAVEEFPIWVESEIEVMIDSCDSHGQLDHELMDLVVFAEEADIDIEQQLIVSGIYSRLEELERLIPPEDDYEPDRGRFTDDDAPNMDSMFDSLRE